MFKTDHDNQSVKTLFGGFKMKVLNFMMKECLL